MRRYIRYAVAIIGIALFLGSVGGSDTGMMPFGQAVVQSLIGVTMLGAIAMTQKEKAADDLQIDNGNAVE